LAGYNSALSACGIAIRPEYIRLGAHGERTAHHLTHELLALPARPTAIFAMSDMQAFGALAAAREHGLRVPDDISVIGFDDIELSQHIGLTTVRQHLRESGSVGMARLLQYLDQNTTQAAPVMPNPVLVARATTSRPPHRSHLT
jgi:LacI family transcriptional regulator